MSVQHARYNSSMRNPEAQSMLVLNPISLNQNSQGERVQEDSFSLHCDSITKCPCALELARPMLLVLLQAAQGSLAGTVVDEYEELRNPSIRFDSYNGRGVCSAGVYSIL